MSAAAIPSSFETWKQVRTGLWSTYAERRQILKERGLKLSILGANVIRANPLVRAGLTYDLVLVPFDTLLPDFKGYWEEAYPALIRAGEVEGLKKCPVDVALLALAEYPEEMVSQWTVCAGEPISIDRRGPESHFVPEFYRSYVRKDPRPRITGYSATVRDPYCRRFLFVR